MPATCTLRARAEARLHFAPLRTLRVCAQRAKMHARGAVPFKLSPRTPVEKKTQYNVGNAHRGSRKRLSSQVVPDRVLKRTHPCCGVGACSQQMQTRAGRRFRRKSGIVLLKRDGIILSERIFTLLLQNFGPHHLRRTRPKSVKKRFFKRERQKVV